MAMIQSRMKQKELVPEGKFSCASCGRTYVLANSLIKHIRYECGGKKKYACNFCNTAFTQNGSLRRHLQNSHNIFVEPRKKFILNVLRD